MIQNLREVTVGRLSCSDILIDERCVCASNNHAVIYDAGQSLMFRDTSTNGTLVNNRMVHRQTVSICQGDVILLAGKYLLPWSEINRFFPVIHRPTLINQPLPFNPTIVDCNILPSPDNLPVKHRTGDIDHEIECEIAKWNWGAFFLYPYWGFANGMWWAFFIGIFLGWSFFPSIFFGINGSKWAWKYKKWRDLEHFISVQTSWKNWGIGILVVTLFFYFCFFLFYVLVFSRYVY